MIPIATWEITSNDDPFMGISLSIYCAGCNRSCEGCHSPALQDEANGNPMLAIDIVKVIQDRLDLIESVVFLGGEWTLYKQELEYIAHECKLFDKRTILYTGNKILDLPQSLLEHIDIIIDGEYKEELKTDYKIPASSNQSVYIKQLQRPLFMDSPYDWLVTNDWLIANREGYHILVHPLQLPINREN